MYFTLAWRNIWRNKRRTFITVGSISFAVFIAVVMQSMQKGSYARMVDTAVSFYTGYIQVHKDGYWEEKILDNIMPLDEGQISQIEGVDHVKLVFPRLESFALASKEMNSKGVVVLGIDPDKENQLTNLKSKIAHGQYLQPNDDGALISEGLAEYLELGVGDTLVLIGQGYHGVNAAGKFLVQGVLDIPSPEMNSGTVYLPLQRAQWFYGAEGLISGYVIDVQEQNMVPGVTAELQTLFDSEIYEVMDWPTMLPDLVQSIELDYVSGLVMLIILYFIISFGILGTFIMMTNERSYEFGVMTAIGTQKLRLVLIMFLEILMLAALSVVVGSLLAMPLVLYFNANPIVMTGETANMYEKFGVEPIIPFAKDPMIFIHHAAVVFIVSVLLSVYPVVSILNLKIIKALKS